MADCFRLRAVDEELEIEFHKDTLVIGRDRTCDVVIKHEDVSRRHVRVKVKGDKVTVQDLESTNGTSVNGRRVFAETAIASGDVLKLGAKAFYLLAPHDRVSDVTILESNLAGVLGDTQGSYIEHGFAQGDETVFHQKFPLPAGWSTYREEDEFSASARDTHADKTVDKLLAEKLAQDPAISAALVVLSGNHASRVKPLVITGDKQTWVIGREGNADLQFSDVSISARHAALIHDDGVWRIEDKDSTNGVKVNNNKEGRRLLQDRDSINLGGVEMVFCLPKRS